MEYICRICELKFEMDKELMKDQVPVCKVCDEKLMEWKRKPER